MNILLLVHEAADKEMNWPMAFLMLGAIVVMSWVLVKMFGD